MSWPTCTCERCPNLVQAYELEEDNTTPVWDKCRTCGLILCDLCSGDGCCGARPAKMNPSYMDFLSMQE